MKNLLNRLGLPASKTKSDQRRAAPIKAATPSNLADHSALFEREILNPADGIHVAVGYGLANCIMIEGDDGIIIVDTMESATRARQVLAAFRAITDKPVAAIILTHGHPDHVFGGAVFAEGRDVPVHAHATTTMEIDRTVNVARDVLHMRAARMFGSLLSPDDVINLGIGPDLAVEPADIALLRPTAVFDEELEVAIAGVKLRLVHAPGETPDQIFIHLPEQAVLLPADNIYQAFPNLYTIRGTAYRDVMDWVASLDSMRDLNAEVLVPSHTRPVIGGDDVKERLTAYRDAIQYVHDQTVRRLNAGLTPDQIVRAVSLPPHLSGHPWLTELYGTVAWSVRAICDGYLGWFSGDAVDLDPLPPAAFSKRLAKTVAAGKPLADQAQQAIDRAKTRNDWQWAAELARHWMRIEPQAEAPKKALATALEALAARQANPNARYYCQTQAQELRGAIAVTRPDPSRTADGFINDLPIDRVMRALPVRLAAENCLDDDLVAVFDFADVARTFTVHIRRGVAEVRERQADNPDIRFTVDATTWKRIVSGKRNIAAAYAAGDIKVEGGLPAAIGFLNRFR